MKPIYLSLAGLQSYRDKQEVDFTSLCEAGVFGIFGPTGSGKSTILDAITLALYGKVERALNGTQGIMNHAENSLSVSFIFQLTDRSGPRTYRVDRQFKRNGENSIQNTLSRLIDESGAPPTVLADKVSEVNQQIQDILGLTMQDFTRAVVLPQGKFAEFLSLKGSERRQMLQRLFRLERYGDLLNSRISTETKETEITAKQLEAEQQGLGDASQEALEEAKQRLDEAEQAAKLRRAERQAAEQEWERLNQRFQWGQELQRLKQQHVEFLTQEEQIRSKEASLRQAGQAEAIVPFLEQLEESALKKEKQTSLHKQAEQELLQAKQELERATAAFTKAKEQLAAGEGPLRIRLEHLQEAVKWEAEWKQKNSELEEQVKQAEKARAETARETELLHKAQETLAKAQARQNELKLKQKEVTVSLEMRNRLLEAAKIRDKQLLLNEQKEENRKESERVHAQIQAAEKMSHRLGERMTHHRKLLEAAWQRGEQLWRQLRSIEFAWRGWFNTAAMFRDKLNELQRKQEQENLAHQLSGMLRSGEPCPVCGSVEHPLIANPVSESGKSLPAVQWLHELEACMTEGREAQAQLRHWQQSCRLTMDMLLNEMNANVEDEAAAAVLEDHSASESESFDPVPSIEQLNELIHQYRQALNQGQELKQLLEAWSRDAKPLVNQYSQTEREHHEQTVHLKSLRAQSEPNVVKEQKINAALAEVQMIWNRDYPEWSMEELPERLARLKEMDQEAEDISRRLDKSVEYIDDWQQQVEKRQQHVIELDKEQLQLDIQIKALKEAAQQLKDRLQERVGSQPVHEQIAAASRQLQQWLEEEKMSFEHWKTCQHHVGEQDRKTASTEQQLQSALEQHQTAEKRWQHELEKSPFTTVDEVKQAILSAEQKHLWNEECENYREQLARLKTKMEELTLQLNEEQVSTEQWEDQKRKVAEAKQEDENALTAKARAERDLEELTRRHEQWVLLETKRQATQDQLTYLHKLQSVFRGNAFVEYIAEEQLQQVSRAASGRLAELTRQRYCIELDSSGGFVIRDDANGGIRRPVGSLSGGETFLTSLALALALSAQVQLNGRYPLEFFFLDEGFGTLDPELLDTVVGALEKLHFDKLTVGIISHVPELRARLPRRLIVSHAEPAGQGSQIQLEVL